MPQLKDPKYERFAQVMAKATSAEPIYIADAYMQCGYACKNTKVAKAAAGRLMMKPEIKARIAELQAKVTDSVVEKTAITRSEVIRMLLEDRDIARYLWQSGAAVKATELLGKEYGLWEGKGAGNRDEQAELPVSKIDDPKVIDMVERIRTGNHPSRRIGAKPLC